MIDVNLPSLREQLVADGNQTWGGAKVILAPTTLTDYCLRFQKTNESVFFQKSTIVCSGQTLLAVCVCVHESVYTAILQGITRLMGTQQDQIPDSGVLRKGHGSLVRKCVFVTCGCECVCVWSAVKLWVEVASTAPAQAEQSSSLPEQNPEDSS